ncbi:MAG TPA: MBL fold metallo-hydrolase [Caulobacteraceae bacterium]|nr:MBL fold metallo-hydrolase [Caulobacteraceae bacterium]
MVRTLLASIVATCALAAAPVHAAVKTLKIVQLDLEGSGGTLYVTPEGVSVLVDAGSVAGSMWTTSLDGAKGPADRIAAAAKALGLKKLDYVIATHYHGDHIGGIAELLALMPMGTFVDHGVNRELFNPADNPKEPPRTQAGYLRYLQLIKGHRRIIVKAGDVLHFGSLTDTVVAADGKPISRPLPGAGEPGQACGLPPMADDKGLENQKSIASLFSFGKVKIAAFGDLTWDREHDLVCPVDKVGHVNIMILDNHGMGVSNHPGFVHTLRPDLAIMGNGSKKGDWPDVVKTINSSPGLQGLWRVHATTVYPPEQDGDPNYLANLGPLPSHGYSIQLDVTRSGAVTVTNARNGFSKTYQVQ